MSETQKRLLGSLVRAALLVAFAKFPKLAASLGLGIDEATGVIVEWIGAGGVIAWSLVQKWLVSHKIATALVLPPGSTEKDLNTVIKQTTPGMVPTPEVAAEIVANNPTP